MGAGAALVSAMARHESTGRALVQQAPVARTKGRVDAEIALK
jgi:hypothetical protein